MTLNLLLSCAALLPSCPSAERVNLGALISRLHSYAERPITTCGILLKRSESYPSEYEFWAGGTSSFSMYLDVSRLKNVSDKQQACFTGVVRRRDGMPVAEVRRRKLSETYNPEGLQFPDYVFYPTTTCETRDDD